MPTLVDSSQPHAPAKPAVCIFIVVVEKKREMYKIIDDTGVVRGVLDSLASAMEAAKYIDEFVTISGNGMEIVGRFGVDSVENGVCPDGVAYDWNKAGRIGRVRRERS